MLLNSKALAALGYSKWFIRAVKLAGRLAGDSPFVAGHYVYEDDLKAWLKKHPEFVPNQVVTAQPQRRSKKS